MSGEDVICRITACPDDVVEITDREEIYALAQYIDRMIGAEPGTSKLYSANRITVEKVEQGRKWSYESTSN